MSPGLRMGNAAPAGFPRVSGDEPATSQAAITQFAFSPRERG